MEPSPLSAHRLRPGLPGYLIPFAPLAFAPQRQELSSESLSPPAFLQISTHFTATPGVPLTSPTLKSSSFRRSSSVEPRDFTPDTLNACVPFKPSDSEQRSPPPSYRGCWQGVSRGFLRGLGQERMMLALSPILPPNRSLQPEGLHPPRGVAASDFRPLCKILDCSLP